jgi:hypothetical protein
MDRSHARVQISFTEAIRACERVEDKAAEMAAIRRFMTRHGVPLDWKSGSMLIRFYGRLADVDEAQRLSDRLVDDDPENRHMYLQALIDALAHCKVRFTAA